MTDIIPNRNQYGAFLSDPVMVQAFEQLFARTVSVTPSTPGDTSDTDFAAMSADAKADLALALLANLAAQIGDQPIVRPIIPDYSNDRAYLPSPAPSAEVEDYKPSYQQSSNVDNEEYSPSNSQVLSFSADDAWHESSYLLAALLDRYKNENYQAIQAGYTPTIVYLPTSVSNHEAPYFPARGDCEPNCNDTALLQMGLHPSEPIKDRMETFQHRPIPVIPAKDEMWNYVAPTTHPLNKDDMQLYVPPQSPINNKIEGNTYINGTFTVPKATGKTGIMVDYMAPTYPWQISIGQIIIKSSGSADPAWNIYRGTAPKVIRQYQFDVNNEIWINHQLPYDYAKGTDLWLDLHWSLNVGSINENITWTVDLSYAKGDNQQAFSSILSASVTTASSTTIRQQMSSCIQITGGSMMTLTDMEPDVLICMHIFLAANTGSTKPFLHSADLQYQTTNVGTKNREPDFYA